MSRRAPPTPWSHAALSPKPRDDEAGGPEVVTVAELRRFLRDPAGEFLRRRLDLRLPDEGAAVEDVEPLQLPTRGLDRHHLQTAVLDAALAADTDPLHARLRAAGLLPAGPLAATQLDVLLADTRRCAALYEQWRAGREAGPLSIDLVLDLPHGPVQVLGRIDDDHGDALARLRLGAPTGPSMVRDGLDWLLAAANGSPRTLAQFHDGGDGIQLHGRPAAIPAAARDALRGLLQLRADGLHEPLPWGPYSGWAWWSEFIAKDDRASALKKARERWSGGHDRWGERDGDAFRLTLRGRELFDDAATLRRFEATNNRIFRALVDGVPCDDEAGAEANA